MVASLVNILSGSASATASQKDPRTDPALAAQQRAAAEKAARDQDMEDIRKKGFVAFVRDAMAEQFRQKLREKMLKAMGLDEASLAKMPPALRSQVEQVIEEAIKQQLEQAKGGTSSKAGGTSAGNTDGAGAAAGAQSSHAVQPVQAGLATQASPAASPVTTPTGQKKPGGMICPVIPILAWPGGPSLLG